MHYSCDIRYHRPELPGSMKQSNQAITEDPPAGGWSISVAEFLYCYYVTASKDLFLLKIDGNVS